jgi:hypothetical protein
MLAPLDLNSDATAPRQLVSSLFAAQEGTFGVARRWNDNVASPVAARDDLQRVIGERPCSASASPALSRQAPSEP